MKRLLQFVLLTLLGTGLYLLLGASCAPGSTISTAGTLFGRPIAVQVDHALAAQMLTEPDAATVADLFSTYADSALDTRTLAAIAAKYSMDVATLYFVQRAYEQAHNKRAQDRYFAHLDRLATEEATTALAALQDHYVVFVPGMDYNDTTNGGNFARQRRLLSAGGVSNELILTDPWGLADSNAMVVAGRLRELGAQHERIVVVSASKGGLETVLALGKVMRPEDTRNIKAWVSVGGILKGSPVADTYLHWPKCWKAEIGLLFVGKNISTVQDVSYARREAEFASLHLPDHIRCVHFVGASLMSQVERRIAGHFCSIRSFGPNDGITPLADEVTDGGTVISELGLDHYYSHPDIDRKTIALALVVADMKTTDR